MKEKINKKYKILFENNYVNMVETIVRYQWGCALSKWFKSDSFMPQLNPHKWHLNDGLFCIRPKRW